MTELRRISPVTTMHSFLVPFYYRARERWVLYDVMPVELIHPDEAQGAPILGHELLRLLRGKRPSDCPESERSPFVSDVQHEMFRVYRGYARPFWVLQGSRGGHQVTFSPWQQNVLLSKNLPPEPPQIGDLPFAPFDGRAIQQLQHLNRLHQFANQIDRLRDSASREHAMAESDRIQKEIRQAEYDFVCSQMEEVTDMAMSLVRGSNTRSEHADQVVRVRDGAAAESVDAIQRYLETGDYVMKDFTGVGT